MATSWLDGGYRQIRRSLCVSRGSDVSHTGHLAQDYLRSSRRGPSGRTKWCHRKVNHQSPKGRNAKLPTRELHEPSPACIDYPCRTEKYPSRRAGFNHPQVWIHLAVLVKNFPTSLPLLPLASTQKEPEVAYRVDEKDEKNTRHNCKEAKCAPSSLQVWVWGRVAVTQKKFNSERNVYFSLLHWTTHDNY